MASNITAVTKILFSIVFSLKSSLVKLAMLTQNQRVSHYDQTTHAPIGKFSSIREQIK
jgi:hypothetical protein